MGVLSQVLEYKARKEQQDQADLQAIPQALNIFNQAKQQASEFRLKELMFKGDLASKGLKINDNGTFSRDASLESPLDQLISQGKAATAEKAIYDAGGPAPSMFNKPTQQPTQPDQVSSGQNNSNIVAEDYDQFGRPKSFKDIGAQQKIKDAEALTADTATRFSGAKQGIQNINDIVNGINNFKGDRKDLIYQANLAIEAENAKDTIVPGAKALYKISKLSRTGDQAKRLANSFSTLSENLLRARTGATAPDPEIVREYARTLLKTFQESPDTWNQKLQNDFNFLKSTHDEIRPLRKDETGDYIPINQSQDLEKIHREKPLGDQIRENAINAAKDAFSPSNLLTAATMGIPVANTARGAEMVAQAVKPAATKAAEIITKANSVNKPIETIDTMVKASREALLKKFVPQEQKLYEKALDKIKADSNPISNPTTLKDTLESMKNANGKFLTPQIEKAHKTISKLLDNGEEISNKNIVDIIKDLKGKFTGNVGETKANNLSAAHDITQFLSGKSSNILKAANSRYSSYKTTMNQFDDLINIKGGPKETDAIVKSLANNDLGMNQVEVLQNLENVTGLSGLAKVMIQARGKVQAQNALDRFNLFNFKPQEIIKGGNKMVTGTQKTPPVSMIKKTVKIKKSK